MRAQFRPSKNPLLVGLCALACSACGGGGSTGDTTTVSTPPPATTSTPTPTLPPTSAPLVPVAYRLSDTTDAAKPDYVKAMATLPNGNVVATLIQSDTIVVDDSQHSTTGAAQTLAGSGSDGGVVVYDKTTGSALTRFSFGGSAPRVVPHGIAADSAGNLIVIGYAAGTGSGSSTVNFGAGDVSFTGGEVPFVAKFNAAGQLQWAHVLQGSAGMGPSNCSGTNCDRAWDIAINTADEVGVVGGFSGTLALPNGTTLTAVGGSDIFVLVLNGSGNQLAAWSIGGPGNEAGFPGTTASPGGLGEMALVAQGTQWVVQGTFANSTEFGGAGSSIIQSPANGARDAFVARYTQSGALQGAVWAAGAVADVTGGLSAPGAMRGDSAGNLYLSLRFNPGGNTLAGCATQAGEKLHTLSLNSALACRWIKRFDFTPGGIHRTVADGSGEVFVAGWFLSSHSFPNQTLTARSTRSDVFLARLDGGTGSVQWGSGIVATASVAAAHIPAGLALDGSGNPWIGGQLFAATEFAQTRLGDASKVLQPSYSGPIAGNSNDGFVARYSRERGTLR